MLKKVFGLCFTIYDLRIINGMTVHNCPYSVVQVFVTAHESVSTKSDEMFDALKRRNYVTPTNYLEFVEGYKNLLSEKKRKLADKAGKLRGGLTKLDETTVQVGEMQV